MKCIRTAALLAGTVLGGCTVSGQYGGGPAIPVGSELVLHQRLELAPEAARIVLQDGEIVPSSRVDRVETACALRLRRRGEKPLVQAIEPGRFLVIGGSRSWAEPARMGRDRDFPHAPRRYEFHTQVEIRSDRQPQVDSLQCSREGWRTGDAPGRAQIRAALADVATLEG